MAAAGVVGVLAVGGGVLAGEHTWPFAGPSRHSSAQVGGANQPGWTGQLGNRTRPAEELWSGTVSLLVGQHYGLNKTPVTALSSCVACLTIEAGPAGRVSLHSDNGILPWPKQTRPSYEDCVRQRESGTLDAVSLATPARGGGLAVHGWLCATGRDDDIVRLQYQGGEPGGQSYRFLVTTWHRPFA